MKRSFMFLSSFILLSAMAFATATPSIWDIFDRNRKKRHESVPEFSAVPMLVLSLGTVAGGLALRQRRRATKTVA
jgi:hypothetical protein